MRKGLTVLITAALMLALAGPVVFAQNAGNNQVSFGAACLVALSDQTASAGPGIQVSWVHTRLFRNIAGLGVHAGGIAVVGENVALGATLIAGPAITAFDNGVFRIPVTLGLHADYVTAKEFWVWNVGAGVVADAVWQFGKTWYAYGRVQAACNFGAFEFHITPGLGMGLAW